MRRFFGVFFSALLAFLGLILIRDGVGYFFDDSDLTQDYKRTEATITSSEERKWGSEGVRQTGLQQSTSASYRCAYTVEFVYEGKTYLQRASWLNELYERARGEACGAQRYGETVPVWLQEGYNDSPPTVREVGDRSESSTSGGFLLLMGIGFLYGSYRLARRTWRRWKAADATG